MKQTDRQPNESLEQYAKRTDSSAKKEELKAPGYGNKKLEGPNKPNT
ncbi:hypothetical protein [Salinithrix halophila]|uniref:Uncharacterized protein n=1 Tax=Salinithrix halophila TaxID=1485204 RepID=A0ABV8JE34_9BACL